MKIQKIIDLCKKSGALYIIDANGVQWVCNGFATYPLVGLPEFTPETLCETFGLSEDAQSKMILKTKTAEEMSGIDFSDLNGDEEAAEVLKIGITYGGAQLLALKCDGGIYFIKGKYLSPFKEDVELWKRKTDHNEYFVITTGMLTAGIVLPELEFRPQLAGELRDLVNML